MKVFIVAFLALAVGASAFPQEFEIENREEQRNAVEGLMRGLIEALSQLIRENNWDPLQVDWLRIQHSPQPGVDMGLQIQGLNLLGASDIEILGLTWSPFGNRLQLTVALPKISFSLGESYLEVNYHGTKHRAEGSGYFEMTRVVVALDIRINIIPSISVRSVEASLRIQNMWSDIDMIINGEDYSPVLNKLINVRIPRWMQENRDLIDFVLSEAVKWALQYILDSR